ncbi:hypothetical protein [Hyalangium minutum]|uniref:hypothetical protein n=1 Tax=Hyalangium minutum TaxID=394096 RepID=UPI0005C77685|nr:hypothetical protein [Hyalangium minutum]
MTSALKIALLCLTAVTASAEEPSKLERPFTPNPYIPAVATLYEQARYEEALAKVEKAVGWRSNEVQELVWLKLMRGVLLAEQSPEAALQSFREALAMDVSVQLPVKGPRRLRRLFAQARGTLALPDGSREDEEELELETPAVAREEAADGSPRQLGWSMNIRGEVDVLGLGVTTTVTPVVSIGYTQERVGGLLGVVVQSSPGLRAEARFHLSTQGGLRPYAGLGTTAFFHELNAQRTPTFFGGVSGRGVLGVEVQWTSRLYGFADVAYERFLRRKELYRSDSVLFSIGVGLRAWASRASSSVSPR